MIESSVAKRGLLSIDARRSSKREGCCADGLVGPEVVGTSVDAELLQVQIVDLKHCDHLHTDDWMNLILLALDVILEVDYDCDLSYLMIL